MRVAVCIVALLVFGAGCTTPQYVPAKKYRLEIHPQVSEASPSGKSLGVRPLDPATPYKLRIVFRESEYLLGSYETSEWAEPPRDMVTRALCDALTATKRFKDVGNAADMAAPDFILTGELRRFDEVRTATPWVAECEVRFEVRQANENNAVWAQTFSAKEPLANNDVTALPAAMSRAVSTIVQQATEGIKEMPVK